MEQGLKGFLHRANCCFWVGITDFVRVIGLLTVATPSLTTMDSSRTVVWLQEAGLTAELRGEKITTGGRRGQARAANRADPGRGHQPGRQGQRVEARNAPCAAYAAAGSGKHEIQAASEYQL